jgi:DNA-3-methyladenine glycosylase II
MSTFSISPTGSFSLREAARFFRGWAPDSTRDGVHLPLALVLDDLEQVAGVAVAERDGRVVGAVTGCDDVDAVRAQVARIFSLDRDDAGYADVGRRDAVVGRLQGEAPGLRPVLFSTAYEAAAWAILSQRIAMKQAAGIRRRLSEALGRAVTVDGETLHTFPLPADLLAASALPGVPDVKAARLRSLAERALAGDLDVARLRALDPDDARAALRELPGIGPFSAELVLLRGCGTVDEFAPNEPRLGGIMARHYGVDATDAAALARIADGWRPYRTWVSVLLRATG